MTHTYTCRAQSKQVFLSLSWVSLGSLAVQGLPLERNDFFFFFRGWGVQRRAMITNTRVGPLGTGGGGKTLRGAVTQTGNGIMTRVLASK